jgi:hypothetical protein
MKPKVKRLILIAPLAILGMALFIIIGGGLVQWLWNWLLPALFGWPQVTFWQALGLLALCRILFGGWHSSSRPDWRRRMRERLTERYEAMTSEEREKFRQRVRERWGFDPAGESKEQ